jgi:hypothetical protein
MAVRTRNREEEQRMEGFPVIRIYADEAGVTHFADEWIDLESGGDIGMLSEPVQASSAVFRATGAGYDYDWHPTPARQFIFMMSGEIEIEVGDGQKRRIRAGDTLFLEDTEPPGHKSRNIGEVPRYSVFLRTDAPVPFASRSTEEPR